MEKIYQYIKDHASEPSEALAWVERQTHIRTNHARMLSGAVQGQIMRMLVQLSGAKRILELGTFTGYSAICLASALPEDGHLDTLEINDELEDLIAVYKYQLDIIESKDESNEELTADNNLYKAQLLYKDYEQKIAAATRTNAALYRKEVVENLGNEIKEQATDALKKEIIRAVISVAKKSRILRSTNTAHIFFIQAMSVCGIM